MTAPAYPQVGAGLFLSRALGCPCQGGKVPAARCGPQTLSWPFRAWGCSAKLTCSAPLSAHGLQLEVERSNQYKDWLWRKGKEEKAFSPSPRRPLQKDQVAGLTGSVTCTAGHSSSPCSVSCPLSPRADSCPQASFTETLSSGCSESASWNTCLCSESRCSSQAGRCRSSQQGPRYVTPASRC